MGRVVDVIQDVKKIYLCTPNLVPITVLNGVDTDSVDYETHTKDYSELHFEVARFITLRDGNVVESNGYEDIKVMMYLYLEDIGYFQIQEPEIVNDGNYEYKEVTAYSIEKEFEQKDWLGLRINTGDPDSLEQLATDNLNDLGFAKEFVTFYNPDNAELSFVDLMLTKMPGWTVGHIDRKLYYNVVPRIDLSNSNLYAIMTTEVAPRMSCIFIFDFLHKQVNAYHQSDIDFDTNIFIGFRNLAQEVEISVDEDSVFTEFRVRGDGELSCRNANFGSDQIFDLSYFTGKPWMSDALANKVRQWINMREANRNSYTSAAREAAKYNEQLYDLKYRVPSDETYWRQWDNMNEEGLNENLKVFRAELEMLQVSVDDNPSYDQEGHYVPRMNGSEVYHDWYLNRLYVSENGYGGYYTYKEIITYIIPYIETALDNMNKLPENKVKYGDESAENWSLYGYIELDAKRKNYEEDKLPALDKFKHPWSALSEEQKTAYVNEAGYNAAGRSMYEHIVQMLGDAHTEGTIYYYLNLLNTQIRSAESNLERVEGTMSSIADNVSLDGPNSPFTEDERKLIHTLLVDTDYTNSNILTTSIDTVSTTIDHEVELYEDAVEKLSESAQPQYSFKVSLDNLLRIPQFEGWVEDLRLLRFIRLGIRDDYSVKLRVVGIKYNPCEITPNLELEFSSMITSKSGRSDLTDIIKNSKNRGSKNSITLGTGNSSNESEYLTSLLSMITKSGAFKGAVTNIASGMVTNLDTTAVNNIIAAYLQNTNISGSGGISLTADSIAAQLLEAHSARIDEVFTEYLDAEVIIGNILKAQSGAFEELSAGTFDRLVAKYINAESSNTRTQLTHNSYIRNQIIENLSVADLQAGDIVLSNAMRIVSQNGRLQMDGQTLQIIGKDGGNNDYVGVQLGYDTSGTPSLVLRNSSGTVILDPTGIKQDAVADDLIVTRMIGDGQITENKLSFDVWKRDDTITIENIYTEGGDQFGAEWTNYTTKVNTVETSVGTLDSQIGEIDSRVNDMVSSAVSQTYPRYCSSISMDEPPSSDANWTDDPSSLDYSDGSYIWTKNVIVYVDGHEIETDPVMITGNDGEQGVGVASIEGYYLTTSLGTDVTVKTRGWERVPQVMTPEKRYLWSYQVITYTNGEQENTQPIIIGTFGESGKDGRSVISFSPIYHRSTTKDYSSIDPPGAPIVYLAVAEGKIYTTRTDNPAVIGQDGIGDSFIADNNATSGVGGQVNEYLISGSTTSWSYSTPEWEQDTYLWVCYEVVYSDGTVEYTTPFCDDSWESARAIADSAANQVRFELTETIGGIRTIADNANRLIENQVWQTDITSTINNLNIGGINLCDMSELYSYKNGVLTAVQEDATNITKSGQKTISVNGDPDYYPGFKIDVSSVEVQGAVKILVVDGLYRYLYNSSSEHSDNELQNVRIAYQCYGSDNTVIQGDSNKIIQFDIDNDDDTAADNTKKHRFATILSVPSNTSYINIGLGQYPYSHAYELGSVSVKDESVFDATTYINERLQRQQVTLDQISSLVQNISSDGEIDLSEISQKADMISLIVQSGSTTSNITLTENFLGAVAQNIDLVGNATFYSLTTTENGTTVINGGMISANSIDARSLHVTDLSTITANIGQITSGSLQSADYAYTSGNFADAGMKIDLNDKYIRSMNFAIKPNGNVYLNDAHLSNAYLTGGIVATNVTLQDDQNSPFATLNANGFSLSRGSINLANHFMVDAYGHTTISFAQGDTNVTDAFTVQKSNGEGVAPTKYIYVDAQGNLKINGETIQLTAGSLSSKLTALEQNDTALTTKITDGDSTTMTHTYNNGVLIGKVNQSPCALVSANGSFDIVQVTWNNGVPTVGTAYASFGQANSVGGSNVVTQSDLQQGAKYCICATQADTQAKVASCRDTSFTLTSGTVIHVKFNYANTATSPTLNVNNTGAKPIFIEGSAVSAQSSPWANNETITLSYDGTNWNVIGQMYINADNILAGTLQAVRIIATNESDIAGWIIDDPPTADHMEAAFRSPWRQISGDDPYEYQTVFKTSTDATHGVIFIKNRRTIDDVVTETYPFQVRPNGAAFSTNPAFQWDYGSVDSNNKYNYIQLRQGGNSDQGYSLSLVKYDITEDPQNPDLQFYTLIDKDGNFLPSHITKTELAAEYVSKQVTAITPTLASDIGTLYKNNSFKIGPLVYINVQINNVSISRNTNTPLFYIPKSYTPTTSEGFVLLSGVYSNSTFIHTWIGNYTVENHDQTWVYCRNDNEAVNNKLVIIQGLYYIS